MADGSATINIEPALAPTDEVRALVDELETILAAEYPPEQRHGLALDAIFQPHIKFFVVRLDGAAVGCGGVALFDGFAELVKRFWGSGFGELPGLLVAGDGVGADEDFAHDGDEGDFAGSLVLRDEA
ncbi:MAG TPA: hypothetical protein VFQ90_04725, partial [Stellaceae bacterium]|nr:hypothetical protein [Stellaceae bacterium]